MEVCKVGVAAYGDGIESIRRVVGRVVSGGLVNVLDVLEGQLDQHHQEDQQGPMNGGHNIG